MTNELIDIKSMNIDELKQMILDMGEPAYRSAQIFESLHKRLIKEAAEITGLPKSLREKLDKLCYFAPLSLVAVQESKKSGTKKFLFETHEAHRIESVFMPYKHGNSICISSQAGCSMGCRFCASTIDGLSRSLTASEMLEQVYEIIRITGEKVSNVTVMGIGEPLDNYVNLVAFIRLISSEAGLNLSPRRITVSTCGIAPKITELAKEGLPITLAVSLHAPTDEKRELLMPIAKRYPLNSLVEVCTDYFKQTGRRISFEYALIDGVNDSESDAKELSALLTRTRIGAHVNIISVNPVSERDFKPVSRDKLENFKNLLEKNKINVTIRRAMGQDIDGACGQLRKKTSQKERL